MPAADNDVSLEALLRRLEAGELDYATALAQFPGELLDAAFRPAPSGDCYTNSP
jgi:hypothetical protein